MALISLQDVSIGFGGPRLLEQINLQIESGERIGLLGRNGMGKSTLLKLVSGEILPHSGTIARQQNVRVAYLPQEVPGGLSGRAADIIASGLEAVPSPLDDEHQWQRQHQIDKIISRMELDPEAKFETLSAGMKRRVYLARGLVREPDLLLLDEPTNHLDINAIDWLESFLKRWSGTLLFVTHDRVFLQNLATRIVELDRGQLFDWNCDYPTFIKRKEEMLSAEQSQNALFDKKLAQEDIDTARLLAAAYTSYDKHYGPRAVEAAEADALGALIGVIREAADAIRNLPATDGRVIGLLPILDHMDAYLFLTKAVQP
jgi:ATP-binding cassette subfamily F protein uup